MDNLGASKKVAGERHVRDKGKFILMHPNSRFKHTAGSMVLTDVQNFQTQWSQSDQPTRKQI